MGVFQSKMPEKRLFSFKYSQILIENLTDSCDNGV